MLRKPKALPLTAICKTQPTVIEQVDCRVCARRPKVASSSPKVRQGGHRLQGCPHPRTSKCPHLGTSGGQTNVPLVFDDDHGAIRWAKKAISLGSKSRCFVELLWTQGVDHVVEVQDIEAAVFGIDGEDPQKMFVPRDTLKKFVRRLRKDLLEARFPYEIETVKKNSENFSTLQIAGFRLKLKQMSPKGT